MLAAEFRENVTYEKVLDLVGDGALLAQNDGSEGTNHSQSSFLLARVLLVIWSSLITVDNVVDEL